MAFERQFGLRKLILSRCFRCQVVHWSNLFVNTRVYLDGTTHNRKHRLSPKGFSCKQWYGSHYFVGNKSKFRFRMKITVQKCSECKLNVGKGCEHVYEIIQLNIYLMSAIHKNDALVFCSMAAQRPSAHFFCMW